MTKYLKNLSKAIKLQLVNISLLILEFFLSLISYFIILDQNNLPNNFTLTLSYTLLVAIGTIIIITIPLLIVISLKKTVKNINITNKIQNGKHNVLGIFILIGGIIYILFSILSLVDYHSIIQIGNLHAFLIARIINDIVRFIIGIFAIYTAILILTSEKELSITNYKK